MLPSCWLFDNVANSLFHFFQTKWNATITTLNNVIDDDVCVTLSRIRRVGDALTNNAGLHPARWMQRASEPVAVTENSISATPSRITQTRLAGCSNSRNT